MLLNLKRYTLKGKDIFLHSFLNPIEICLEKHPPFWIGSLLLLGTALGLGWGLPLIPWIILFIYPWTRKKQWGHLLACFLLLFTAYAHAKIRSPPTITQEKLHGIGYFTPQELRDDTSIFGKSLISKGTLLSFKTDTAEHLKNIPCLIYIKQKEVRNYLNCDYLIQGTLIAKNHGYFLFKPDKKPWQQIEDSFSRASWRYEVKKKALSYLKKHFTNGSSLSFISAITLGIIEEKELVHHFRSLGLSHILAISGFHFALLSALGLSLLYRLFPQKIAIMLCLFLLSFYAFFLGNSPSVLRAWIALSLILIASLLGWRTTALSAFGTGLIVEICLAPTVITQLSFQLSFLATAAILMFYPIAEYTWGKMLVARSKEDLNMLSLFDKHLYLISAFLRKMLALNTSVYLVIIPISFFYFSTFPMASFLYNLIYPPLIAVSMSWFIITLPIDFCIPYLGSLLHDWNDTWIQTLLNMIAHPSIEWTIQIPVYSFAIDLYPWMFSFYGLGLLVVAIRHNTL